MLKTDDVAAIKALGRQASGYMESDWNGLRQLAIYEGLYTKFGQNEELKKHLPDTKDALLAECAVKDTIWGIGLSMKDVDRFNKYEWKGENLLGYALMAVREKY